MKLLVILLIVLIFFMTIMAHELTHYEIFRSYNCEDMGFKIDWKGVYATATCPNDDGELAHNINEIVGYNIIPMLMLILTAMIMGVKNDT